jgi:stage II sporulation protein P
MGVKMLKREKGKGAGGTLMTLLLLVGFLTLGVKYFNLDQAFSPFVSKWESWLQNGTLALPTMGKLKEQGTAGPQVAILYAHPGQCYGKEDLTEEGEIVQVGTELAGYLQERGIEVLHQRQNAAASYAEAKEVLSNLAQELKQQYPSLQIILDLHRDAAPQTIRQTYKLTISEAGGEKQLARLQFLLPQAQDQKLALLAGELWSEAEKKYPGLLRGMVRTGNHGLLTVMVGDWQANSLSEAKASARLLGELLSQVLD